MASDKWLLFNDIELVNLSRTAQLVQALGIDTLWVTPDSVQWIEDALGGVDYGDVTEAPWYDPGYPASAEFAGVVPLSIPALDDSTLEASTTEYITSGGKSGKPRNATLPIVASVALVASTDRGADYGKRWMDKVLSGAGTQSFCAGSDLRYFRFAVTGDETAQFAYRREVVLTRGTSVTRKRSNDCSSTWLVTFTWTANDPFEYGEAIQQFVGLGGDVNGPGVVTEGGYLDLIEESCPAFDYTPIYDPLFPALVAPPVAPDFFPAGWAIEDGDLFDRYWVRLAPVEPTSLDLVPVITVTSATESRTMRLMMWPSTADEDERCDPLFGVVMTYKPAAVDLIIDGVQGASYVYDGVSPRVRRADSLVYSPAAEPVQWTKFNDPGGLLVALDLFPGSSGDVRVALAFVPKSD